SRSSTPFGAASAGFGAFAIVRRSRQRLPCGWRDGTEAGYLVDVPFGPARRLLARRARRGRRLVAPALPRSSRRAFHRSADRTAARSDPPRPSRLRWLRFLPDGAPPGPSSAPQPAALSFDSSEPFNPPSLRTSLRRARR